MTGHKDAERLKSSGNRPDSLPWQPDPAMNIEPGVPPGEEALRPFVAQQGYECGLLWGAVFAVGTEP
jgi:hypothetical protein